MALKRTFSMLKISLKIIVFAVICIPLSAFAFVALALIGFRDVPFVSQCRSLAASERERASWAVDAHAYKCKLPSA
jgi:hypothetical protein